MEHKVFQFMNELVALRNDIKKNIEFNQAFDSVFYEVNAIPGCNLHSLMVIQDGKIIYERYGMGHTATELHTMWSATKTFTATAITALFLTKKNCFFNKKSVVISLLWHDFCGIK